ncbi:hypothetical protein MKW94_001911 [Papaver nudicaule]|uniref:mRNA (guanine-N(7))-methyltransferase n=1 Tax=Papaver nudicaule TaxID=74823 RepID=A0AA41RK91_PAPNU|nr:hypothetical protein [Papaver nudicaule]
MRYNGEDADQRNQKRRRSGSRFTFPARLLCADCFEVRLDGVLRGDGPFDICSCQFAMHYSWSSEARARQALANISALLRPGGTFIGTMPDANYMFHLEDAVDCPEWIVSFPVFKSLAEEYDLEIVFVRNFHEFVDQYLKMPQFAEIMRHLGALGTGNQGSSTISPDEWEVTYLYSAFVLKKRGEPDPNRRRANRANNGPAMHINN